MILEWSSTLATQFKPEEQLLGILFDGGIMTREQIMVVSKFSLRKIRRCRERAHRLTSDVPIQKIVLVGGKQGVAYALSMVGVRYVYEMLGYENHRVQTAPEGQLSHYIGTNNVLVRAVEAFGRENIEWLSTRELAEDIELQRRLGNRSSIYRGRPIRPDASIRIRKSDPVWIEYDNNTESPAKLEQKFLAYWQLSQERGKKMRTVLWVTGSERRKDYLERVFKAMTRVHGWGDGMQHLFFVEGQDTKWLESSH
ncbi:replication-relaxation family protein [Alicyclobacillus sp. SO9]|uniref:replication-relaxation family protein n=1 Tax=Alicyclobacillus sp. SO9 TaxID=2665646 RepID=UPI0018E866CC|nr:replication-relaxation family protein [Alicyclobacillus sp. SO9]QQE79566.1 replication-relaxation family protein [Alicyclobacillus sp. SO9]